MLGLVWLLATAPSPPAPLITGWERGDGLSVVAARGDEQVSSTELKRALGTFDRERTPVIEQRFLLVNKGTASFEIAKLQGSCGCTDLLLYPGDRRPAKPGPIPPLSPADGRTVMILAPGEKATVRAVLNIGRLATGAFHKYIWVYLPGEMNPAVTITLDLAIESHLAPATRLVDFAKVRAGEGRTIPFTVSLDASLFQGATPSLGLSATNEDVRVRPAGGSQTTFQGGVAMVEQSYEITLSPRASIGEISGALVLREEAKRTGKMAPRSVAVLKGQVEGEVRISPSTVLFGAIPAGQSARQTATLWVERPEVRSGLRVTTSAPWLAARVLPGESSLTLETELKRGAPPGPVEWTVTLTTASGQRLVVPVIGVVLRSP